MPDASGQFVVAEGQMETAQLLAVAGPLIRKCGSGDALAAFQSTLFRNEVRVA